MIGPERLAAGERAEAEGDYLSAAAAYRLVAAVPDETLAAEANFCLGRVSWRQGRFGAALAAFEDARAIAARLADPSLLARIQNGIGAVHYARGDHSAARTAYAAALASTTNEGLRGKITLNLGVIENIEGRYEDALARYESAYRIFLANGDEASALLAVHNRGMVEADLRRWDEADASFGLALALAEGAGNREMVAKTLVNRSEVFVERGALRAAIEQCDKALAIYAQVGDEVGRGEALRWRGHALGQAGDLAAAERNVLEAMHIAVRSEMRLLEAEAARDLGVLRGRMGDAPGSNKMLRRALALFHALRAAREASEVQLLLDTPPLGRAMAYTSAGEPGVGQTPG